jgi:hypothetical protein
VLAKLGAGVPGMLECFESEDQLRQRLAAGYAKRLADIVP